MPLHVDENDSYLLSTHHLQYSAGAKVLEVLVVGKFLEESLPLISLPSVLPCLAVPQVNPLQGAPPHFPPPPVVAHFPPPDHSLGKERLLKNIKEGGKKAFIQIVSIKEFHST